VAAQADLLEESLKEAVDLSFNRITIDGDTSTNDMVIMMANGRARNDFLDTHSPQLTAFKTLLISLCVDLATLILKDAEGSTKIINIRVEGACTCTDAQRIAYQIANSCLVKTAIYGEDANWGRIMAAIGNAEADIDPGEIDILFDNVVVVEKSVDNGMKLQAQEIMKRPKYQVTIKLHHGTGIAEIATTDLTIEYVKINSAYPT
jgi:glutamate N-acetyltransferase/amino-acid N-acetyltransferase